MFEARRWHQDQRFHTPCVDFLGKLVFVEDVLEVWDNCSNFFYAKVRKILQSVCTKINSLLLSMHSLAVQRTYPTSHAAFPTTGT